MDFRQVREKTIATPGRRRALKIAATLFCSWVLLCMVAWLAGPALIKNYATKFVREQFGHELVIAGIKVNPLLLAVTIRQLDLREPSGESLVSFREMLVDLDAQTLVRGMLILDEFRLDGLVVNVERTGPDRFNFSDLADRLAARAAGADKQKPAAPPKPAAKDANAGPAVNFLVRKTEFNNAAFHFVDRTHSPAFENWLRPINLSMADLTSRPQREAPYELQASIGSGGTIGWKGDLSLQPLRSKGTLELRDFGLKAAYDYLKSQFAFGLPSGALNVRVDYVADFSGTQSVLQVTDGMVSIDKLALTDPDGNPLFAFDKTAASGIVADLVKSTATIGLVETRGGHVEAVVNADGSTNIQRALLPPVGAAVAGTAPVVAAPAASTAPVATPVAPAKKSATADAAKPPAWTISVAHAAIRDYALHLVDRSVEPAADIALTGVDFETGRVTLPDPQPVSFTLAASLAAGGTLGVQGDYGLADGAVKADIRLADLAVAPFSPYLARVGRLSLTDGRIGWQGKVSALANGTRALHAEGSGSLKQLAVRDDVHKTKLVRLGELGIDGFSYDDATKGKAPRLVLRRLLLAGLDADMAIDRDGVSNLQQVFAPAGKPATGTAPAEKPGAEKSGAPKTAAKPGAAPAMDMRLDTFVIRDTTVNFRDASPDLSFAAQLTGFGGHIDGLSSDPAKRAKVELAGTIDKYAPITVTGEINPLAAVTYSDVHVRLASLDLGALTPYTVTYIAYPLARGKLGVQLDWKVAERKFDARNRVLIDGLALGEKREAPRATKLPVKLAIALLTDRAGNADLAVPAYGELDDPKFRVGSVILTALGNLVTKAVTSPFAALGSLGGGDGDKAGQVAFAPGAVVAVAGETDKLAKIAQALADRPMLSLSIAGTASADGDRAALRRAELDLRIKREYLDSPFRHGRSVDEVTLSASQRRDELFALYHKTTGKDVADLHDAQGKPLPDAERQAAAENDLLAGIAIDDGALRELARARAQFTKDRLLAAGVAEARLFVVDGEILPKVDGDVPTRLALDAK